MKKLLLLLLSLSFIGLTYAHSGRTDSKGGHWNHSTATYHYHSKSYSSDSSLDAFFTNPRPLCYGKPKYARGINGMTFETKEQCLKRFKKQREMLIERILEKKIKDDKKNIFINEYFLNFINNN